MRLCDRSVFQPHIPDVYKRQVIAAGKIGKLKTLTQFIGIVLILLGNPLFNRIGVPFDQIVIWISVVLAVWSCTDYIVKNLKALKFD